jgi:hypothetical protein
MEVNAKIKELEDEFKVLKAEIRNVLLDIREVILERKNPLGEDHESAFIRMDLNTTAHAMASEVAAHEAAKAADAEASEALHDAGEHHPAEHEPEHHHHEEHPSPEVHSDEPAPPAPAAANEAPSSADSETEIAPAPTVIRRDPREIPGFELEAPIAKAEIPPMYMAGLPPLSGNGSLAAWVVESIALVGPQGLERIIAIHRLWGNLPPNISRALAHLQELLHESEDASPPWLKVMLDLDRLASL